MSKWFIALALIFMGLLVKANCNLQPRFSYQTQGLTVSFTNKSEGDYKMLQWTFSDGTTSEEANPQHTFARAGQYTFSLTVSNPEGCSKTFEGNVYVFNTKHNNNKPTEALPNITQPNQQLTTPVAGNTRSVAATKGRSTIQLIGSLGNFPNPFNVATNVTFSLSESSPVQVSVYDLNSRLIQILYNGKMNSGIQNIVLERNKLPSGMYMLRVNTPDSSSSRKIIID